MFRFLPAVAALACLGLAGAGAAMPCQTGDSPLPPGGYGVCLLSAEHQDVSYGAPPTYWYQGTSDTNAPVFVSEQQSLGFAGATTNVGAQQYDDANAYGWSYPGASGEGASSGRWTFAGAQGGFSPVPGYGFDYSAGYQQGGVQGTSQGQWGDQPFHQAFQQNTTSIGLLACDNHFDCAGGGVDQQRSSYDDGGGAQTSDTTFVGAFAGPAELGYGQDSENGGPCAQAVDVFGVPVGSSPCTVEAPRIPDAPTFPAPPL